MGLLDTLVERGRNEGMEKGRLESLRSTLAKQLELKFGALSERARTQLRGMDATALDGALERVLTATRLEDVVPTA